MYIDTCLRPVLLPIVRVHRDAVFQQDGARVHTSRVTLSFLGCKGVHFMENWPPRSPQLNPIENLWALVQRKVSECGPTDSEELTAFVLQCWAAFPQEMVDTLVLSFAARCAQCVERGGWC